jgi:multiple sugar transport system permease protein
MKGLTVRKTANLTAYHGLMLVIMAIFLLPFWWMLISAFKSNTEIFARPVSWFPNPIRFDSIIGLFKRPDLPFIRQFLNSCFYAGSVAIGVTLSSSLAAYSFACLRWRGRNLVFGLTIGALLMPQVVIFIPVFLGWSRLGFADTYWPLIAPAFLGDAFYIFMLRQFFLSVNRETLDAARLDGASELHIWWQIMLPQMRAPLLIVALFAVVYTWQEFFMPLIYLRKTELFPLSLGLFTFRAARAVEWSLIMAGALLAALPMVALFLVAQRQFMRGLLKTGLW